MEFQPNASYNVYSKVSESALQNVKAYVRETQIITAQSSIGQVRRNDSRQ